MLPEEYRLRASRDFDAARQHGRHWRNQMFIINAVPNSQPVSRFGFVVGRKLGTAVKRNRLKRQLRAIVAHLIPAIVGKHDIVIVARAYAAGRPFAELELQLASVLQKAELLNRPQGSAL